MKKKEILVSGVQPSGQLHIANYFGAIKQMVDLVNTDKYEAYIFLADYHSMTTLSNKEERLKNIYESAATYLACGLDKNKVNIFKQSDVPSVTELTWIFDTVTPLPMLFLAHSFKDKERDKENEKKEVNLGLLNYPVLMASDILLYGADIVPAGKDQEQHIEIAREIAGKYNRAYKVETFKSPKIFSSKKVSLIPGTDGNKMSKSKKNYIPIFAEEQELKKVVMGIKTDSLSPDEKKNPDDNNIYNIHKLFLTEEEDLELRNKFLNSDKVPYSYKQAKEELLNTIISYFKVMKKRYDYYVYTDRGKREIKAILRKGAKNANNKAKKTIKIVRKDTGLDF